MTGLERTCAVHGNAECFRFGACPECGASEHLNVHMNHWGMCPQHKVRWLLGSNLFSDWRDEDAAVWKRNRELLAFLAEVEPIFWCDDMRRQVPRP